ncbi:MAG: tetratricopeptide (TPR) repeat protein [Kiritimatiellia bacterium]|jgi:tetratricopeptide (TPR) repeat protein
MRGWIVGVIVGMAGPQAWAVDCDDVQGMLSAGLSEEQVVTTMRLAADAWTEEEVGCLRTAGTPAKVTHAAIASQTRTKDARMEHSDSAPDTTPTIDVGLPPALMRVPRLQQAGKHRAASLALSRALGEFPGYNVQLHYLLARSLAAMDLLQGAQHHYMKVIRAGPDHPQFRVALIELVSIANRTGNDLEVRRFAHLLHERHIPRSLRGEMVYLRGVRAIDLGNLAEAQRLFDTVPYGTSRSRRASYLRGVMLHERGKLASAVRAFREVAAAPDVEHADDQQAHRLRQLGRLNLGRIHYQAERFEEAESWYDQVEQGDPAFARSLFERSGSRFVRGDHDGALGSLLSQESPHFRATHFHPGADLLRALTWYELGQADRVHSDLARLQVRYRPDLVELTTFIDEHKPIDALVAFERDAPFSEQISQRL